MLLVLVFVCLLTPAVVDVRIHLLATYVDPLSKQPVACAIVHMTNLSSTTIWYEGLCSGGPDYLANNLVDGKWLYHSYSMKPTRRIALHCGETIAFEVPLYENASKIIVGLPFSSHWYSHYWGSLDETAWSKTTDVPAGTFEPVKGSGKAPVKTGDGIKGTE
jgi:hypothetical protein